MTTGIAPAAAAKATPKVLTSIRQVHGLSAEEAARGLPVDLHAVVTVVSGFRNSFFIADSSGGISVDSDEHATGAKAGDAVEVIGVSTPGSFAPSVVVKEVRILGRGRLPSPRLNTYAELAGGIKDSEWVAIRGVVRSARILPLWNDPVLTLSVEAGGGLITVYIRHFAPGDGPSLIDAEVYLRGVITTQFNQKRQFIGMGMFVTSMNEVQVEAKPPADPYAIPLTPVRSMMQFKPGIRQGHRVKIEGTVTLQEQGRLLYVQQGSDGIQINTDQAEKVLPGTLVEAVGFPDVGSFSPVLRNAEFRISRKSVAPTPVAPVSIQAKDFLVEKDGFFYVPNDEQLVRVKGEMVEQISRLKEDVWLLRDGSSHFSVHLRREPNVALPEIQSGSVLEVTGVFSVQVDEDRRPTGFRIMLRDPHDIAVVKLASWWNTSHALSLLLVVLLVTGGTVLWGITLRKQVNRQTGKLRESEERFRRQAQHDALTGLASRSFLLETLQAEIKRAQATRRRLGVLMLDLDHFKQINDTLGHHAGDQLLQLVAQRLLASVRSQDVVARMGGDEFVVLLRGLNDPSEAEMIGAKVVGSISAPARLGDQPILVSASVGVCTYPEAGVSEDTLLQNVDAAMYKAKVGGRNSFSVYRRTPSLPVAPQAPTLEALVPQGGVLPAVAAAEQQRSGEGSGPAYN